MWVTKPMVSEGLKYEYIINHFEAHDKIFECVITMVKYLNFAILSAMIYFAKIIKALVKSYKFIAISTNFHFQLPVLPLQDKEQVAIVKLHMHRLLFYIINII